MSMLPGLITLLLPALLAGTGPAPAPDEPTALRLLVPAYFYPDGRGMGQWDRLLATEGRAEVIVIVNPASGPGRRVDRNYAALLDRIARTDLLPIGYVSTDYARRPIDEAKADVDRYVRFYPGIRGIFFDEQASGPEHVDHQAELYAHVRERHGLELVVTNPGTRCDEGYLSRPASDVVCLFERPGPVRGYNLPDWASRYAPSRIAVLAYEVEDADQMRQHVRRAVSEGIGVLYVTDADGTMPWGRLPSYWDEQVDAAIAAGPALPD